MQGIITELDDFYGNRKKECVVNFLKDKPTGAFQSIKFSDRKIESWIGQIVGLFTKGNIVAVPLA